MGSLKSVQSAFLPTEMNVTPHKAKPERTAAYRGPDHHQIAGWFSTQRIALRVHRETWRQAVIWLPPASLGPSSPTSCRPRSLGSDDSITHFLGIWADPMDGSGSAPGIWKDFFKFGRRSYLEGCSLGTSLTKRGPGSWFIHWSGFSCQICLLRWLRAWKSRCVSRRGNYSGGGKWMTQILPRS